MIEKVYNITNETGVHARSATALVSAVTPFKAKAIMEYNGREVDLRSIMGVISLGVPAGVSVKISVAGEDEEEVITKIEEVLKEEELSE